MFFCVSGQMVWLINDGAYLLLGEHPLWTVHDELPKILVDTNSSQPLQLIAIIDIYWHAVQNYILSPHLHHSLMSDSEKAVFFTKKITSSSSRTRNENSLMISAFIFSSILHDKKAKKTWRKCNPIL